MRGVVFYACGAVVAERPEKVLSVRVDVKVQTDSAPGFQRINLRFNSAQFGRVAGGLALVGLGAGICAGATGDLPFVRPVAVDVPADARVSRKCLPVLAPEAVGGLRVDEAVWVYDGSDVEVEFVDERLDGRV